MNVSLLKDMAIPLAGWKTHAIEHKRLAIYRNCLGDIAACRLLSADDSAVATTAGMRRLKWS
jgi:hypothetical protein